MTPEHLANHYSQLRMSPATADYAKGEVEKFTKLPGYEELTKLYNARCRELMAQQMGRSNASSGN